MLSLVCDTIGPSNEKASLPVPITWLTVTTAHRKSFLGVTELLHAIVVVDVHEAHKHSAWLSCELGEASRLPKLSPATVTVSPLLRAALPRPCETMAASNVKAAVAVPTRSLTKMKRV